jgi:hypothetical protein
MSFILNILKIPKKFTIWFVVKSIHSLFHLCSFIKLFLLNIFQPTSVDLFLLSDHLNLFHCVLIGQDCVEFNLTDGGCGLVHDGVREPKDLTDFHRHDNDGVGEDGVIL